jgi:phenylpyruvate tautomerase PptA (4-oxalocrotonate tautomerase family)
MPTYTVFTPPGALTNADKQRIAGDVTRTHSEVTDVQKFFVQVMFVDMPPSNWFVGGAQVTPNAVFVHGQIRSGRTATMQRDLLTGLRDVVGSSLGVPKTSVWVYIVEVPSVQMVEYGHVLPEPGGEAQWLAGLPPEDRALMESTGAGSKLFSNTKEIHTSINLPHPIAAYFSADAKDGDAVARCFTDDGVVTDEGQTHRGRAAIKAWKDTASLKFTYTTKPFASKTESGLTVVTSHVVGDFPGSPVDLRYAFGVKGDKIASLRVTP